MAGLPVIRATSFILVHAPSTMLQLGTTVILERERDPRSEYMQQLASRLRSFSEAVNYPPNQVFIGNMKPGELACLSQPWYEQALPQAGAEGRFGAIWDEAEFFAAMKIVDTFDLVQITPELAEQTRSAVERRGVFTPAQLSRLEQTMSREQVERLLKEEAAPLYYRGQLVGCVRRGHEIDDTLKAHVIYENLASKASGVLALLYLCRLNQVDPLKIEYLMECSEEAVGDMNQRGGGNLAKAIGEQSGCGSATGVDIRAFCAGPTHALINAAALVQSRVFRQVVVLAGGAPAKLGLNSRDHVLRGMPVLEDMLGGFAVLVAEDDGYSPVIRTDAVGVHRIASGSAPQAVIQALVVEPLQRLGLKITDVDLYAPELQNPEITIPAGAGDVPLANYRMIAALAVRRGEIERRQLDEFVRNHGVVGFAPTQGHIPSGVPLLGHLREELLRGGIRRAMVIGKGSLFLGRMTNLFDGTSLLLEANPGRGKVTVGREGEARAGKKGEETAAKAAVGGEKGESGEAANGRRRIWQRYRVGLTVSGSELGEAELLKGARMAASWLPELEILLIGGRPAAGPTICHYPLDDEQDASRVMEELLDSKEISAAVTMHYSFPIGLATVGRVITPGRGREMFIATTTGATHQERIKSMLLNAVGGIAVARACGMENPSLGIVNVEGAAAVKRKLLDLAERSYRINWGRSRRADGGELLRGNDLLSGEVDVAVVDTLTGNLLMKFFSAYTTGGGYESLGYGYGPAVGPALGADYKRLILIVSRASGAPVVAGAIRYSLELLKGGVRERVVEEYAAAGLTDNTPAAGRGSDGTGGAIAAAQSRPGLTAEVPGVEVLELEHAQEQLHRAGIRAEMGMGCTGPVLLVSPADLQLARKVLKEHGYINA